MGRDNNFEVKPCMIEMNERCVDFGTICCNTLEDRLAFNNYIDSNNLSKDLKFDIEISYDLSGGNIPF